MKLLALTLVLATLTGCQASVLDDDMDQVEHFFVEYFRNISRIVDEEEDLFQNFNLSKWISDHVNERLSDLSRFYQNLAFEVNKAEPLHEAIEAFNLVVKIVVAVAQKSHEAVWEFTNRMRHPTEKLYEALRPVAAPHAKPVLEELRQFANAILSEMREENREEDEWVKLKLQELDAELGPTVKEVLKRLQEFWVAQRPFEDEAEEKIANSLARATEPLKPYINLILKDLREYTKAIEKWARTPLFPETQ
ncbi:uncharacterized protein LOC129343048 [Eublepharis macularius]|uniref:Uncharacterized protein LOC129343048 n=1 Tax=Eublepharis macularius TaxID=481883 RepID=A0AA97KFJ3_EUBMA|nr:uncharacterized protein LOC129343048 [Eublepharis macularius]